MASSARPTVQVPVSDYFLGNQQFAWNGADPDTTTYSFGSGAPAMIDDVAEVEQPTGSQLHLEKILVVPQERVFAAFVDAEQLRRWWGPAGFTVQVG